MFLHLTIYLQNTILFHFYLLYNENGDDMKKILIFVLFFFLYTPMIYATTDKIPVTFSKCVDGDTAKVMLNQKEITVRFLAIDTPETKHPQKGEEPFGKEASNYTCNKLKKANKIELEYDGKEKTDKYDRHLAWVFVDDSLLQKELIQKGYAEVAYLYDDYKYTTILQKEESLAKLEKKGKWNDSLIQTKEYIKIACLIITIIIVVLLFIFNKKYRKKAMNKMKRKVRKKISNLV